MAIDPNRYASLDEVAQPGTEVPGNVEHDAAANSAQQAVDQEHAVREFGADLADNGPTRPTGHPGASLGWTEKGGMDHQQASAMAWVKAGHEQRQNSHQTPEHKESELQKGEGKRELSFFEDKNPPERNYGELKREDAERTLSFYEDRNPADPTRTL